MTDINDWPGHPDADPDCECCLGDGLQADGETPCPCQNRRPAPDAVARLVEAARAGLNYLENTEGEFGITLGSATGLRAALAAMEASDDRA